MSDGDDAVDGVDANAAADPGFRALLDKVSESYNFDLRDYKPASLVRRLRTRMGQVHADTFAAYASILDSRPEEHVALFNTILINVTGFLRDPEAWAALGSEVIPRLVAEADQTRTIRIWSAGCSSGEEPFSVALLLAEHLGDRASEFQVKIYGTDIDEDALAEARHGLYRTDQLKDLPDGILDRYFTRDGQLWRLRRDIRRWCIFGAHNLTHAPPLSHIDLLICRNVLIYFGSALQERILSRFHYALRDGGFLFLGRSESLLARSRLFAPLQLKWRIFQRITAMSRGPMAVLPEPVVVPPSAVVRGEPGTATRLQRALDALPAAVMVIDAADTILSWNPAAEALFETPAANAVGRKFRDIDVSYRVEGLRARMEDAKARHAAARLENVSFTRRTGEAVYAHVAIAPLFDNYRLIGVMVAVDEATEHARLKEQMSRIAEQHATAIEELQSTNEELETTNEELQSTNEELETTVEELQAANAELAALNAELEERGAELARLDGFHRGVVNSMDAGLLVIDRLGIVRTWNQSAERMWGLRSEQVTGRDFFTLPLGDFVERTHVAFEHMLATAQTQEVDGVSYTLPGGAVRRAALRIAPVKDGGGETVGGVVTASPQAERAPDR